MLLQLLVPLVRAFTLVGCGAGRPGHVAPACNLAWFAKCCDFTDLMVQVGISFFRRLMAGNGAMMMVTAMCPEFTQYVQTLEDYPREQISCDFIGIRHKVCLSNRAWLILITLTCIQLAAKVLEQVPSKRFLTTMMSHIYEHDGQGVVDPEWGAELEMEILQALDWRLGPVFRRSE